jgi:hypothetical protein
MYLEQLRKFSKPGDCLRKLLSSQSVQVLFDTLRRFTKAFPVTFCRAANGTRGEIQQVSQEIIRVLGLDTVWFEAVDREVIGVARDNQICSGPDRSRQDMAVTGIREFEPPDQSFIAGYQAVENMSIHEVLGPVKLFSSKVRPLLRQVSDPFFMDTVRPPGAKQAGQR